MSQYRPRVLAALSLAAVCGTTLSLPAGAAAGPLKATSFVRGVAVEDASRGGLRAFAGDFDGDGKDDVIYAGTREASLVYGTNPSEDANLGADLAGKGWKTGLLSTGVYDVDTAGDFDGDGVDDVLINSNSRLYLVYGSAVRRTGTLTLDPSSSTPPAGVTQINTPLYSDGDAGGIGDFNGDGYDDVAVQRGPAGLAVVYGGPRAAVIDGAARGARVSLINATQRCAWFWFTYRCVSLGVNFDRAGDFDGDGKDDLEIENTGADGNLILYGKTGTFTQSAVAGSGLTRLPNGQTGDIASVVGNYTGVGDVNGDGRGDLAGWGSVLVHGRAGRPASIARTSPLVALQRGSLTDPIVVGIGDQNADGKDDLGVYGSGAGSPIRVVTSLPSAPGAIDLSSGTPVAGLPAEVWMDIRGGGDLDGDGVGDLLVPTVFPFDSTYLLTHGTGSPGGVSRPASLEAGIRPLDALGDPIYEFSASVTAVCSGETATAETNEFGWPVALGNHTEGDDCTVTPTIAFTTPSKYAKCIWKDTVTLAYDQQLQAGAPFKLAAGKNHWEIERRCELPTTDYPAGFQAVGWGAAGSASGDLTFSIDLNGLGPNQAGAIMWASPLDWRNKTIEFNVRIAGGTGSAEGMTVAFVRPDASGQPQGGRVGGSGPLLGFGGLGGVAVGIDTKKDAGDPTGNFMGFTDGPSGTGGLRWLRVAPASTPYREPAGHTIKIVNSGGTTEVFVDGRGKLKGSLAIPASSYLAFTSATGSLYQLHSVSALKVS